MMMMTQAGRLAPAEHWLSCTTRGHGNAACESRDAAAAAAACCYYVLAARAVPGPPFNCRGLADLTDADDDDDGDK